MSSDFTLRGRPVEPGGRSTEEVAEAFDATEGFAYRIQSEVAVGRAARGAAQIVELSGDDDDVIEIEDQHGYVSFHRAGALATTAQRRDLRGYDLMTVLAEVATRDGLGQISAVRRGSVTFPDRVEKALKEIRENLAGVDPRQQAKDFLLGRAIDAATRKAMQVVVNWIDSPAPPNAPEEKKRKRPKPAGLYTIGSELLLQPDRLRPVVAQTDPFLLLLHGTFSHAEGAFGGLRGTAEWESLIERHGGQALALEHPTLGMTPVENALEAARALPAGARLHMVSHSRGGLVGEVLSYAAAQRPNLRFLQAVKHPDAANLKELHTLVADKGIRVERFVRVACPARGTILASRRMDRYANYLFNVFKLIPFLRETGVAALVKQVLLAFLDQRTDASIVPGLEAQMPTSPLVRTLNTADPIDDGLGVIAGDIQGSGIGKRIMVAAADLFYREDHDLVVNTSAMYAGVPRRRGGRSFYQGAKVHHSAYFANEDSRQALQRWLTADDLADAGFEAIGVEVESERRRARRAGARSIAETGSTVVVIPDMFGSVLQRRDGEVWPHVGRLSRLGVPDVLDPVTSGRASGLTTTYDPLVDGLRLDHAVTEFPYDWRRRPDDLATGLTELLEKLTADGGAVHVVAHGAGALVALLAAGSAVGVRLRKQGGRVLLLGPPLGGTWAAVARLQGRDGFTAALSLIDPQTTPEQAGQVLSRLPLMAALLPWGDDTDWGWLGDAQPLPQDLADAKAIRDAIGRLDVTGVGVIAGHGPTITRNPAGDDYILSGAGDGFSPYGAGPLNLPLGFAAVPHALLPASDLVLGSVRQILAGKTASALMLAPPPPGAPQELGDYRQRMLFPTVGELVQLAHGGADERAEEEIDRTLRVSVVHGNLRNIDTPLLVGTYDGTPLDGAERALDRELGGALSRRMALSQFPGPAGTYDVVVPEAGTNLWAVVVGMGDSGAVTPAELSAGVTSAVLKTAALRLDRLGAERERDAFTLSSVLMGTAGTGALAISSSMAAIVEGVARANRKLADGDYPIHIDHLQFVELFEERAIAAVHAAQDLPALIGGGSRRAGQIVVDQRLVQGCDGAPGRPDMGYDAGEWVTVRVQSTGSDPDGATMDLAYTTLGRRARAEQRLSSGQRDLIDRMIRDSIENPTVDPQLYNTLYELITPLSMKTPGREWDNVMYVLDPAAARLPFEMLAVRPGDDAEEVLPMATRSGMVRRLATSTFRDHVRPASGSMALVIGDPPTGDFARLPGARAEARRVADLLRRRGYEVVELISKDDDDVSIDPVRVFNALFAHDYRIIHIAAHGNFSTDANKNGVVLADGVYLTAAEVEKMQTTPDLVFLNCCHIGSMTPLSGDGAAEEWRPDLLTASIAGQLIDNGVRMFVGAGWAVNDRSAAEFAETFYRELLDGADLGAASKAARVQIWNRYARQSDNTWGAYQVYGPPAAAMTTRFEQWLERPVRSAREFRDRLGDLSEQAAEAAGAAVASLAEAARELIASAAAEWTTGESDYLAGALWFEIGDYPAAVASLESSVRRWGARAPMRAYELLVNVRAKWAVALAEDGDGTSAAEQFEEAERMIGGLLGMGETPERHALLGSYWRRRMQAATRNEERRIAATKSRDAYARAAELHRERIGSPDYYTELNRLAMDGIVRMHGRARSVQGSELELIEACAAAGARQRCPNFWSRATAGDALLTRCLLERTITGHATDIERCYAQAFAASSPKNRASIVEHLRILAAGMPDLQSGSRRDERDALRAIADRLAGWKPS